MNNYSNLIMTNTLITKTLSKLFPEDILTMVNEFIRPCGLRLDWRTCKRKESRRIKMSDRALTLWYKWIFGPGYHPLFEEIKRWSFYGRRHLIRVSRTRRFWTMENTDNHYEKKYRELSPYDNPIHTTWAGGIERDMAKVSLIV